MMNEWILSSSLLIAAVLLGRRLLRGRISLRLQYALWLVVLVRLLLPVQLFTSDFGAGSMAQNVDISEPVRQVYHSAREADYERAYDAAYRQVVAEYEAASKTYDPVILEREAAVQARQTMELDLNKLLWEIWIGGMIVMTLVIAACNVHLGLQLKRSRRELPVSDSLLPVYVTEAVPTPCIFGLFHPAIYLTPAAAGDETIRRHVLTHELTHYRHGDHFWSVLRSVCLILHWYNPLVWMAASVSRADAELACDEGALAKLGESHRADYGRTLIGLTCPDSGSSMFVTATTMTGSAGSIRERIKLLMKRPRNTVLALISVILVGAVVVGCSFAGAPETAEPAESTAPGVDNDMSYQDQDLPIPELPGSILSDNGILVFPGTKWFMTEEEVLSALGVSREDCWEWERTSGEGMTANSFTVRYADAFGVPMELCFTFRSFWDDVEPGLTEVYGHFDNQADFEAVRTLYAKELGETDHKNTPGIEETWYSEATFRDLFDLEGNEILRDRVREDVLDLPASWVNWVDSGSQAISWHTELPLPVDQVEEVRALFGEYADPVHRAALTRLYEYLEEPIEYSEEDIFVPEITEITIQQSDAAVVYYRKPGDFRLYAAQLYFNDTDGWYVFGNRMVVSMDDYADRNPRALTEQEMTRFRSVFGTLNADGEINPAACFLLNYYEDVTRMRRSDFMAYFPGSTGGTEREFELLKEKYPDFFGDWTWENMPIPIHSYETKELNSVLRRFADMRWEDMADDGTHYLEETGCWYNYTSDFGLGGFAARSGFVYDGGAVVLGDWAALIFVERAGEYFVQAYVPVHFPAVVN